MAKDKQLSKSSKTFVKAGPSNAAHTFTAPKGSNGGHRDQFIPKKMPKAK